MRLNVYRLFQAIKHCRAPISVYSDMSFPSTAMSMAAPICAARAACLHRHPCSALSSGYILGLQVWRQAPEDDQTAAIGIVVACMEAAQDVSRLLFNCALCLITSAPYHLENLPVYLMLKTCCLRCCSVPLRWTHRISIQLVSAFGSRCMT